MQWIFPPIAVFSGMLSVLQSVCNGTLQKIIDRPVTVAVISLSIGIVMLVIVGAVSGQLGFATSGTTVQASWWAWLGGLCGALALLSQPIAVPRLGAAMYIGLSVTASTLFSVLLDHFGWLGVTEHTAGIGRILGCALMVIGVGLISIF